MTSIEPLGDRAFLSRFNTEAAAAQWAASLRTAELAGVGEVVLAYDTVATIAEANFDQLEELEQRLRGLSVGNFPTEPGRLIVIPVLYDGPDLPEVAIQTRLSAAEVIRRHCDMTYHVYAIGFLPGFSYLGYLDPEISGIPRRPTPRNRVPYGSVAIAGRQTGIYPGESPGGWHLIGRTPLRIVDIEQDHFPISTGDQIRFLPIEIAEFQARAGELLE